MLLLIVAGQTAAIYVFLVVALGRLRRQALAELTPIGYLITALLGSAVETGLYHGSGSLAAGLVSAATLVAADKVAMWLLSTFPRLRRWLVGVPILLVYNGQILTTHLQQVHMTEQDLRAALRQRGCGDVKDARLAVLEIDGSVGVIQRKRSEPEKKHS